MIDRDLPKGSRCNVCHLFREACCAGCLSDVRTLLALRHDCAPHVQEDNHAAFRGACKEGRIGVVDELLKLTGDQQVDIHAANDEALRLSAKNGYSAVVQRLLHQATSDKSNFNSDVMLNSAIEAARRGFLSVLRLLVDFQGGQPVKFSANGVTLLRVAFSYKKDECIQYLLRFQSPFSGSINVAEYTRAALAALQRAEDPCCIATLLKQAERDYESADFKTQQLVRAVLSTTLTQSLDDDYDDDDINKQLQQRALELTAIRGVSNSAKTGIHFTPDVDYGHHDVDFAQYLDIPHSATGKSACEQAANFKPHSALIENSSPELKIAPGLKRIDQSMFHGSGLPLCSFSRQHSAIHIACSETPMANFHFDPLEMTRPLLFLVQCAVLAEVHHAILRASIMQLARGASGTIGRALLRLVQQCVWEGIRVPVFLASLAHRESEQLPAYLPRPRPIPAVGRQNSQPAADDAAESIAALAPSALKPAALEPAGVQNPDCLNASAVCRHGRRHMVLHRFQRRIQQLLERKSLALSCKRSRLGTAV